jgi:3-dehydroquinate dehydratase-1
MMHAMGFAIGNLKLGGRARVAVPFRDDATRAGVRGLVARGLDVAELRVDLFASRDPSYALGVLPVFADVPTLATIRCAAEGGSWSAPEDERLALYRSLVPRVDAIDVEISSSIAPDVISATRAAGKLAIASFHDFDRTPDLRSLGARIEAGRALGADVVKIAAQVRDASDLRSLARLLVTHDESGLALIVIGMGDAGVASRVFFPALGSLLTYASGGTQTAPGQLGLDEAVALLRRLGL